MDKQTTRVHVYMLNHDHITALEAMNDLGIFRLGARIYDLKAQGVPVMDDWKEVTNRFGEKCRIKMYWLPDKEAQDAK